MDRLDIKINNIKAEMNNVKQQFKISEDEMKLIKEEQSKQAYLLINLQSENEQVKEICESLQLDNEYLNSQLDRKSDKIDKLEEEVDFLDRESRKCNMRIFGLQQLTEESELELKQMIVDNVLKVACKGEDWATDDIANAYRVGKTNDKNEKLVIMKFRFDDDKTKVYKGREKLREKGVRVADDLTQRQRHLLQLTRDRGKIGYFYKGKLVVKDRPKNTDNTGKERVFLTASRKNPSNNKDGHFIFTYNVPQEMSVDENIDIQVEHETNRA